MKSLLSFLKPYNNKPACQKTEYIDGIKFVFRKNPLSKYIRISLKQDRYVLVSMPKRASFPAAKEFAKENLPEIKKVFQNAPQKEYILDGEMFESREKYILRSGKKQKVTFPRGLLK